MAGVLCAVTWCGPIPIYAHGSDRDRGGWIGASAQPELTMALASDPESVVPCIWREQVATHRNAGIFRTLAPGNARTGDDFKRRHVLFPRWIAREDRRVGERRNCGAGHVRVHRTGDASARIGKLDVNSDRRSHYEGIR